MIYCVIMAGGKGERFWPKSRQKMPKQLISLTNDGKTMIQLTVERMQKMIKSENIYIATGEEYASQISYQLPDIPTSNILVEPMGKNTAACIGLAAIHIYNKDPEAIMIVLPSDHIIQNNSEFLHVLKSAVIIAENGDNLVTLGITPTYAETGYGYIKVEKETDYINENKIFKVEKFVEKPNKETAEQYLKSGDYLWNSGMFIWSVATILKNIENFMPDLYAGLMKIKDNMDSEDAEEILFREYSNFKSISIDYGIMEKSDSVYSIPGKFGWNDVGSWNALERIYDLDGDGNFLKGNIISLDTKGCIIEGSDKLIATIGLEDLVIVDTKDATLICPKDKCQDIKSLLKQIKLQKMESYL